MEAFSVHTLLTHTRSITVASFARAQTKDEEQRRKNLDQIRESSKELLQLAMAFNLWHSQRAIEALLIAVEPGVMPDDIHLISSVSRAADLLMMDVERPAFIFIPDNRVQFIKHPIPFGSVVAERFKGLAHDIDEACRCYGVGRSTAAVFHCMRVMEGALKAISLSIDIPSPAKKSKRNWKVMLKAIGDRVDILVKENGQWPREQSYRNLIGDLLIIADAWRNPTVHVESKYTDDHAGAILWTVKGFVERLSAQMDEKGRPVV